jgi:hypothetical protein
MLQQLEGGIVVPLLSLHHGFKEERVVGKALNVVSWAISVLCVPFNGTH